MAKFSYKARKDDGTLVEDVKDSTDRFALAREMRADGLTLISAIPLVEKKENKWSPLVLINQVKQKDKILFASSLSSMISAGLSLARALSVIERQTESKKFKEVLHNILEKVKNGESFSNALGSFPNVFPPVFVAMVGAGEESGNLPGALQVVGDQMQKSYDLRRKVRGAMLYPAIIIVVIILIAILMMIFLVPNITSLFKELNAELPLSTRIVIGTSDFLVEHTFVFLFGLLVFVFGVVRLLRTTKGKRIVATIMLKLPVISKIVKEVNSAVTMRTLSSLLASGVAMVEAVNITKRVVQNPFYQDALTKAALDVEKGKVLSEFFKANDKIYPILVAELAEVGEETGNLTGMMLKGATLYEEEVNQATKNLSTIIEPVLMVFIGIAVGFFAVSMIGPIYSLSEAF